MAVQTEHRPTRVAKELFQQTAQHHGFLTPDQVELVWDFHNIEGQKRHPSEVCTSLGLLEESQAQALKRAMDAESTPGKKPNNVKGLGKILPYPPPMEGADKPGPPPIPAAARNATRKLKKPSNRHGAAPSHETPSGSHARTARTGPALKRNNTPPPSHPRLEARVDRSPKHRLPSGALASDQLHDASKRVSAGLLGLLIKQAIDRGASDLHVYAKMPPFVRIAGAIQELPGAALIDQAKLVSELEAILNPAHWEQLERDGEVDLCPTYKDGYRLRTNVHQARNGLCVTMRIIPPQIPALHELGLPSAVGGLTAFNQGLVIIAGPASCGKTSTMASLLLRLNTLQNLHIVTIEDPIEFVHPSRQCSITQRCVGLHTQSYATALKAALREDPDVIVIGEMRDPETIHIALKAAETGHLVIGTLHTWDVESTLARVLDAFEGEEEQVRSMLADSLRGVLAQQLIRAPTGRRYPIVELMFNNSAVANCIRKRKLHQLQSLIHAGRQQQNMMTWEDSLMELQRKNVLQQQHVAQLLNTVTRTGTLTSGG